ncbi:MAG: hypothetical protein WA432_02495 [Candidatus Babeliaceae bacterium]
MIEHERKRIVLKISGEIFCEPGTRTLNKQLVLSLMQQMVDLAQTYQWSIVIGGGNFFRGAHEGSQLGLKQSMGHAVGMLATIMNGLILQDLLVQTGLKTSLFCALDGFALGKPITPQNLRHALENDDCLIFTGGIGVPYFTTDTTAVVRALQIEAHKIWKLTKVAGIFSADPHYDKNARLLKKINYTDALQNKLGFMDATALVLASEHKLIIRVFSMYEPNALIKAAQDPYFGSILSSHEGKS